jgi:hypothetical protein
VNEKQLNDEEGVIDCIPADFRKNIVWENYSGGYSGRAIPPNENLELLVWSAETYNSNEMDKIKKDKEELRKILAGFIIKIEYYGIHENERYSDERKLSWYNRKI